MTLDPRPSEAASRVEFSKVGGGEVYELDEVGGFRRGSAPAMA